MAWQILNLGVAADETDEGLLRIYICDMRNVIAFVGKCECQGYNLIGVVNLSGKESEMFFIDLKFDMLAAIFRYLVKSVFTVVNEKVDVAQHG